MRLGRHKSIGRRVRQIVGGTVGGSGDGGVASALNSPSTVVYSPESNPANAIVTLPTSFLDTRYNQGGIAFTWASDVTLTDTANAVTNMTNLQAEVDAALTRSGHSRIKLPDSFVASGTLRCGKKTQGNYWTYIQRSSLGTEGTRCTSAQMAAAPIIRATTANRGAVETAVEANCYRFDEIKFDTTASQTQNIVHITPTDANGDNAGSTVNDLPNFVYFSRCEIVGKDNATGDVVNGLTLNCRAGAFVDGRIHQIWRSGVESHCIAAYTCRGPIKLVNNFLETPSITVLFGGADPHIQGFVAEDIEIRRNYMSLRDSWNPFHASWDSIVRPIKNRLEFKMGKRALVEGNVIEKAPLGGQNGEAFVVKSMAGESGLNASWYVTQNITFRYNVGRELWNWLYITGVQMPHLETLGGTDRIYFGHNLIYNYADTRYGNGDCITGIFPGDATNVQFDHMTVIPRQASLGQFHPRSCMWCPDIGAGDMPGLVLKDSIFHAGRFDASRWAFTNTGTDGEAELARVTGSSYTLINSFMIDGPTGVWASGEMSVPASIAAMNFTGDDPSLGLDGDSPAKNAASDGTDAGCNYTKVNLATSGVV